MSTENLGPNGQIAEENASSALLARRRILLKGVGKGASVLVAAVPIQTLAGQSVLTFDGKHQCSISGMHSGVHSATTTTVVCGGYSPGWWGQKNTYGKPKNWPTLPSGWTYKTPFKTVFGDVANLRNTDGTSPSLWQIMEPKEVISKFESYDEFHWVCAWLNAVKVAFNFPYTPQQVVDYYKAGKGTAVYNDALTFFKTFMETHTS